MPPGLLALAGLRVHLASSQSARLTRLLPLARPGGQPVNVARFPSAPFLIADRCRSLLRRQLADERPRYFGCFLSVVIDEEAAARCVLKFDANRQGVARDLVGFADRGMRFQKCDTVFKLNFERVTPREVTSVAKPAELRCAEWHLQSIPRFHAVTGRPLDDGEFAALGQRESHLQSRR